MLNAKQPLQTAPRLRGHTLADKRGATTERKQEELKGNQAHGSTPGEVGWIRKSGHTENLFFTALIHRMDV